LELVRLILGSHVTLEHLRTEKRMTPSKTWTMMKSAEAVVKSMANVLFHPQQGLLRLEIDVTLAEALHTEARRTIWRRPYSA
jgi:hypothetical protein